MNYRYYILNILKQYRFPYLTLKRWEERKINKTTDTDTSIEGIRWATIDDSTDIVIEGFPRSANTYAVVAFRYAQNKDYKVGYRLHAPNQLIAACHCGLPAVALIRTPKDAVLSWVIHRSDITISEALSGYVSFYKVLLSYKEQLVIADFYDVTNQYGEVIKRVNEKFGTRFVEFNQTADNVNECFALIDSYYKKSLGGKTIKNVVARPSEERKQKKKTLIAAYNDPSNAVKRQRAEEIYERLTCIS